MRFTAVTAFVEASSRAFETSWRMRTNPAPAATALMKATVNSVFTRAPALPVRVVVMVGDRAAWRPRPLGSSSASRGHLLSTTWVRRGVGYLARYGWTVPDPHVRVSDERTR